MIKFIEIKSQFNSECCMNASNHSFSGTSRQGFLAAHAYQVGNISQQRYVMIWFTHFSDNIITAVKCKWVEIEHALQWRTWGDAAVTLLEVLSTSFLILKCYSFNSILSFSPPLCLSLCAGSCCLTVTAGCRPGLGGLCSGELGPKRICELMCGFVWQELFSRDWTAKITILGFSLGAWVKGIGELQRVCFGNHKMFLRNLGNRLI